MCAMSTTSFAITNGQPDGEGHPNVGAIFVTLNGARFHVCSGTLISSRVFLTAGHCTSILEGLINSGLIAIPDDLHVSFDSDRAFAEGLIPVMGVETHPNFLANPGTGVGLNDVGVLYLKAEDTAGISAATLPTVGFLADLWIQGLLRQGSDGARFVAVGYGASLDWPPPVIRGGRGVRRVAESEFTNLREQWLQLSQNPSPGRDNGGTCYGDSGGPNFWVQPDGSEVLVGVTSWGDAKCVSTNTTQRTDSLSVATFLVDVIAAHP